MKWTRDLEDRVLYLRDQEKKTYKEIAKDIGTTESSVKHKYIRLRQADNHDKYHHPEEKSAQIRKILGDDRGLFILETNAGWGNLSKVYSDYGYVIAQDIDSKKVEYLRSIENVSAVKCDSFHEIHKHIYNKYIFDVVDLDPYGLPSRYFPHVFQLIHDGYLFVTFPKLGVQQLNKITLEHYRIFWGISLADKDVYLDKILDKIKDFGMMYFRRVDLLDMLDLGRVQRLAFKVKKESALNLVGLTVRR